MLSRGVFAGVAALAVFALPACSGNSAATQVPSAIANSGTAVAGGERSTHNARAFVAATLVPGADCSASTNTSSGGNQTANFVGTGHCSNIQLAGIAYGAGADALMIAGLHPADLQSAYKLPSATAGKGQTIGIVIVNDDPNLESDLAVYRATFGLPACSSATGCLRVLSPQKVSADANWSREASIDVDMASAVCPNCNVLVVEAPSTKDTDLAAAISSAIAAGANVVSNSYTIAETSKESVSLWSHPGVPIVAAAGDRGYGIANWPAASSNVIAVGATTLRRDPLSARGWNEAAWSGSGSGCSTIATKPAWQTDSGCTMRTVADVAAVGDPATPVAVFDTYQNAGWVQMGGSSVATPIVAGIYALAGNAKQVNAASSLYAHRSALFPVSAGSNGSCSPTYLCTASAAYNGPAGLGSPNGIAAF